MTQSEFVQTVLHTVSREAGNRGNFSDAILAERALAGDSAALAQAAFLLSYHPRRDQEACP